jgi:hypothetical protein
MLLDRGGFDGSGLSISPAIMQSALATTVCVGRTVGARHGPKESALKRSCRRHGADTVLARQEPYLILAKIAGVKVES